MPDKGETNPIARGPEASVEAAERPAREALVEPPDAKPATAASPESADSGGQEANGSGLAAGHALQEELPAREDDEDVGFFARFGNAFKGFFRGLRGLPVEIPPGEEGAIPLAEAAATQRRGEKRLAKAQAKLEELRESLDQRKQEIAERDAALQEAQKELKRVRAEAADAGGALRKEAKARVSFEVERADATRRNEELERELARWRIELAAREETIAELRAQMTAAAERWKAELDEAESAAEKLRSELVSTLPQRAEVEGLRARAGRLERELAKKSEQADLLRDDLMALRKRAAEMDERAKQAGESEAQKAAFQRESQRLSVQVEALRDQFTEAQLKVEKLSAALREFHGPAVSALQAAAVYSESLAGSLAMNETDRSDSQELKRNVEQLRQTLQKLTAKLAELGVPHS